MGSLYTAQVRDVFHAQPWPKRLKWEVAELDGFLRFYLFRDNINSLDGEEKLLLANLMNQTLTKISASGIPIQVKVVKGNGDTVRMVDG